MYTAASDHIILQKLVTKEGTLHVPVAELDHQIPGPTILITGGIDGDEYTGIRAAYDLIDWYKTHTFPGRIIVIPIVNTAGFYAGVSLNPLDQKYPKHIYPGNTNGTASEQLMYWVTERYIAQSAHWLDLHSGSHTEALQPFVWAYETKRAKVDGVTKSVLKTLNAKQMVYEKSSFLSKATRLARENCQYLMFECGEKGEQKKEAIQMLEKWVKQTLDVIHTGIAIERQVTCFTNIQSYRAEYDGLWFPSIEVSDVETGMFGGTLTSLDTKKSKQIIIKDSGTILWMKASLQAKKYDDLLAVATNPKSI